MVKNESLQACPRCGSPKGYTYSIRCLDRRVGSWDGVSESDSIEALQGTPKTVRCLACGARAPNPESRPR